jgi:hypothetical protein
MRTIISVLPILSIAAALAAPLSAAQQPFTAPTPESWKQATLPISQADLSGQKDVVRQQRGAVFNDPSPNVARLDSPTSAENVKRGSFPPYFARMSALPVKESETVVVGRVTGMQPYFSDDHKHLYTEFSISVEQKIKDETGRATAGSVIPIVLRGGRMMLPNGRIIEDKPTPTNFSIAQDGRYVFFLHYVPAGQHFAVTKTWELKNGAVLPTSREDMQDQREGKTSYSSMTEAAFVETVRETVQSGQDR